MADVDELFLKACQENIHDRLAQRGPVGQSSDAGQRRAEIGQIPRGWQLRPLSGIPSVGVMPLYNHVGAG
jgi:hypothetical protein